MPSPRVYPQPTVNATMLYCYIDVTKHYLAQELKSISFLSMHSLTQFGNVVGNHTVFFLKFACDELFIYRRLGCVNGLKK